MTSLWYRYICQGNAVSLSPSLKSHLGEAKSFSSLEELRKTLIHPEDFAEIQGCFESLTSADQTVQITYRLPMKSGVMHVTENCWLEWSGDVLESVTSYISPVNRMFIEELDENRLFFEQAKDLLFVRERNGDLVRINEAWTENLGYSKEELLSNMYTSHIVHPEDRKKTLQKVKKIIAGDGDDRFENRYVTKNGEILWFSWRVRYDKERGVLYGEGRDITHFKRTESNLKFQLQFEQLISEISTRFISVGGEEIEEVIKDSLVQLGEFLGLHRIFLAMNNELDNEELHLTETFHWRPGMEEISDDHSPKQITLSSYPFVFNELKSKGYLYLNADNQIPDDFKEESIGYRNKEIGHSFCMLLGYEERYLGYIELVRFKDDVKWSDDIILLLRLYSEVVTNALERKHNEEILWQRNKKLERSNRELEQFAYVASHDLKEPLRTISSYVQLLQKRYQTKLDEDADDFIEYVVRGVNRMQEMIKDMLEYSKLERRTFPVVRVNVNEVLDHIESNLAEKIKSTNTVIGRNTLPVIRADMGQIVRLFQNLVENAIKFSGDNDPVIEISCTEKPHSWNFAVKDNGIGIRKEYEEKVFVIFQRLHSVGDYEGTGIGLAVCKRVVDRHEGEIWFDSEPGKGTTFHFTISKQL